MGTDMWKMRSDTTLRRVTRRTEDILGSLEDCQLRIKRCLENKNQGPEVLARSVSDAISCLQQNLAVEMTGMMSTIVDLTEFGRVVIAADQLDSEKATGCEMCGHLVLPEKEFNTVLDAIFPGGK